MALGARQGSKADPLASMTSSTSKVGSIPGRVPPKAASTAGWIRESKAFVQASSDSQTSIERSSGQVRPELTDEQVADIGWSLNSSEYFVLLAHERGWSPEQFERWLSDAWIRLLLAP